MGRTRMSRAYWTVLCAGVISAACTEAWAELSPDSYARLQKEAPEDLTIEVLAVTTTRTDYPDLADVAVDVEAKVKAVQRSKSDVKTGSVIRIRYHHTIYKKAPPIGPGEIPIIEVGKTYPAFLERAEKATFFEPAARGCSFTRLKQKVNVEKDT